MTKANDRQVGGDHYLNKAIQPWDAMESWMSRERFCGFLHGCAIKYLARYQEKGGVEDLEKAAHYISKLIEVEQDGKLEDLCASNSFFPRGADQAAGGPIGCSTLTHRATTAGAIPRKGKK